MLPKHVPNSERSTGADSFETESKPPVRRDKPEIRPAEVKFCFAITPAMRSWSFQTRTGSRQVDANLPGIDTDGSAAIPFPRWKRAIDLVACLLALPVLGLCTLIMALLTARFAPGPVFFRQERIGYLGRRFNIFKFRTMTVGADCAIHQDYCKNLIQTNAPMVKLDSRGDARLIPLAWVLRASGLDELPQIINVLRGEMTLVGPRPCIPAEFEHYAPWQRQRCNARPGLTGLWQVSGKNRTTFEQMICLDIKYARELSLCLDLKIIFSTLPCLLAQVRDSLRARMSPPASEDRGPPEAPGSVAPNGFRGSIVAQGNSRTG
jgi:lipopolysaccharide/colanic/teichoic acid biosynthesis glycosyltransferase